MGQFPPKKDDITIVLSGEAGQGIQSVEYMLTRILKQYGYHFFATKEYMSRVRGGSNSTLIRVASQRVRAALDRIDILIPLTRESLQHVSDRISDETIIMGERNNLTHNDGDIEYDIIDVAFSELAREAGGKIYANTIAIGLICGLLGLDEELISRKGQEIVDNNINALTKGYGIGVSFIDDGTISVSLSPDEKVKEETFLNGAEAVGSGALSGGCSFISSYPMSPSTAVLTFLARHGEEFSLIAEQAEDEIAAINMALGASYAGARAMVTTSGGGFALMEEGVSLAAMIETPIVIHIAQRPGPATGLPTRTEQADLELALYSGHGEFPRIIFAPGSIEEAFSLSQRAFNLSAKYQVPVFILTDQYFIDSYYNIPVFDTDGLKVEKHIVETEKEYKRYRYTESGISPRGVPGYGSGLVAVDSDTHDEEGHITENLETRVRMVDKRFKRLEAIQAESLLPELFGDADAKIFVLSWGSTKLVVEEAVKALGRKDVASLHFGQVYPFHPDTAEILSKAEKLVSIEGNKTGQLTKLIKLHLGINIENIILKYNGLQYTVDEVVRKLKQIIG